MTQQVAELAAGLDDAFARTSSTASLCWLTTPLLRLLAASGQPVSVDDLAAASGRDVAEVGDALDALPGVERDDQARVLGFGLTVRPTPHRFTVNGRQLFTWCALDTLMFPALLQATADVESPCHGTAAPVRLRVAPDQVDHVDPATAVVSVVVPADVSAIRTSFCEQVHFFTNPEAARPWLAAHPGAVVLDVPDAFTLGRRLATSRFTSQDTPGCC